MTIYISSGMDARSRENAVEQYIRLNKKKNTTAVIATAISDSYLTTGDATMHRLATLSTCEAIFMIKKWYNAPECVLEHELAKVLLIEIIYQ